MRTGICNTAIKCSSALWRIAFLWKRKKKTKKQKPKTIQGKIKKRLRLASLLSFVLPFFSLPPLTEVCNHPRKRREKKKGNNEITPVKPFKAASILDCPLQTLERIFLLFHPFVMFFFSLTFHLVCFVHWDMCCAAPPRRDTRHNFIDR